MILLLKDVFIVMLYLIGILSAVFFALLIFIVIVKLWQGRR